MSTYKQKIKITPSFLSSLTTNKEKKETPDIMVKGYKDDKIHHIHDEDIFVINNNDHPIEIDRKILLDTLNELKPHGNMLLTELTGDLKHAFKNIVEVIISLDKSSSVYNIISDDINHVFSKYSSVKENTVASFFKSCINSDNFNGPIKCNPKCITSIFSSKNCTCDDSVFIYNKNSLSYLVKKDTKFAYIYIEDNHFEGFNDEQLTMLSDLKFEKYTLMYGSKNKNSYDKIIEDISFKDLPRNNSINSLTSSNSSISSNNTDIKDNHDSNRNAAIAIIGFIFIILLLLLIFLIYQNYAGPNNSIYIL